MPVAESKERGTKSVFTYRVRLFLQAAGPEGHSTLVLCGSDDGSDEQSTEDRASRQQSKIRCKVVQSNNCFLDKVAPPSFLYSYAH